MRGPRSVFGKKTWVALACVLLLVGCAGSAEEGHPSQSSTTPSFRLVGVLHDDQALNRPHDVELQGNLAFVPGKGGSLATIDISDPTDPKVVSAVVGPRTIEDAETVLSVGDVLFLGSRDFHAVDMANPAKPEIVKSISDRKQIDKINGMAQRGSYIFSADKTGFVNVFDVRNPRNPALHDTLDAYSRACQSKPHDIAVFGERIIVVDQNEFEPNVASGPVLLRVVSRVERVLRANPGSFKGEFEDSRLRFLELLDRGTDDEIEVAREVE